MKELIDKAAVVAEIERRIAFFSDINNKQVVHGNLDCAIAFVGLRDFLDTLEVKDEHPKDNPLEGILIHGNNDAYRLGYKKAIEKACEWLNNNLLHYWGQINANDTDEFIDNFKKAMEE